MKKTNPNKKHMIEISIGIIMLILGLLLTTFGGLKVNDGWKKIKEREIVENNQTDSTLVESRKKGAVIAVKYFTSMNLFLLKFRMILYSYYVENKFVSKNIENAFNILHFNKKDSRGVNLELVNNNLIEEIFITYDFNKKTAVRFKNSKPVIQLSDTIVFQFFLPESINPHPTDSINGFIWFLGEIQDLKKGCNEILTRYGSVGDTKLIDDIERLIYSINGVERHFSVADVNNKDSLSIKTVQDFFSQYKLSFELSKSYRQE